MACGTGIVKQVISGDAVVLMGNARRGNLVKVVTLASVVAPFMDKSNNAIVCQEPFAWEAREFLRKLLIGEVVKFVVEYESQGKEFASLDFNGDVGLQLISAGLAKIRLNNSFSAQNLKELEIAEEQAKQEHKGVWSLKQGSLQSISQPTRKISSTIEEIQKFVHEHFKQLVPGIIENIINAGTYQVYFPHQSIYCSVVLAGISLPKLTNNISSVEEKKIDNFESLASEAKHFTEIRLLNRDIQVHIEGVDDSEAILGTIIHPKGNITELLLTEGFAQINQKTFNLAWNSQELLKAEKEAQRAKLRIWKSIEKLKSDWGEFMARVIEIVSGDCYIVCPLFDQTSVSEYFEERRVYLASIRCPRMKTRERADEPWAVEAKEFARKKLIGKKVKIVQEYVKARPAQDFFGVEAENVSEPATQLHFVSIWYDNGKSLMNTTLVEEGFAKVTSSRNENEQSFNYAELVEKEAEAASKKKKLHGPSAPVNKINELIGPNFTKQAKSHLESFKRMGVIEGIIDHVFNGRRFKIRIPSENIAIAMALSGIVCPASGGFLAGKQKDPEPLGQEALNFSKQNFLQRKVSFKIATIDLRGTFIGVAWQGNTCLNVRLVEEGFARLSQKTLLPPDISKELLEAESQARMKRSGIWSVTEDNDENIINELEKQSCSLLAEEYSPVFVSFVLSLREFYIQINPGIELNEMQSEIQRFIKSNEESLKKSSSVSRLPQVEKIVLAKFKEDDQWYRARVISKNAKKSESTILFIDYGNTSVVHVPDEIAICPPRFLEKRPFARKCELNGIKAAPDFAQPATEYFESLCAESNTICCVVEHIDPSTQKAAVLLYSDTSKLERSFAESLLAEGLVIADRRARTSIWENLMIAQKEARAKRLNAWCHGDIDDESE